MFQKILVILTSILAFHYNIQAQTTYLQLGEEEYHLLDRLETRSGRLSDSLYLSTQPVGRNRAVSFWEQHLYQSDSNTHLSAIDRHNIRHAISISGEFATAENGAIDSKHSWFHTFYKKQPDFLYVKTKDFFLSLNPVLSAQVMSETYKTGDVSNSQTLLSSSRGIELRGWISKKIHFYTYFADNQEQPVSYVKNWIEQRQAVPGADYYQTPSNKTYDYLQARGYIDFALIKNYVSVNLGYDKQFFGDGIRSLFWSDFSSSMPYLKLNTRIWKFNYQNLYSELTPQYIRGLDQQLPHKYSTTHYLSINATRWLNIGLFENTIFARNDRYQFGYMMPIILFRAVERWNGSPDNVNLGLNIKAMIAKKVQLYGQLFLDEYQAKQLYSDKGWWGNKYGVQLGAKYFDAFGIRNLDLQGEMNMVRPYTYSHDDSTTNYSNYNQPLAHPLGSGFVELIGVARYQPIRDLYLTGKMMYYNKGVDTGGLNYGNDIFKSNGNFANEYGVKMINGLKSTCILLSLNASYKLRERLFFDLGFTYRKYSYDGDYYPANTSMSMYGGFRLNIARRAYDMF
jgi:hypothetical protein